MVNNSGSATTIHTLATRAAKDLPTRQSEVTLLAFPFSRLTESRQISFHLVASPFHGDEFVPVSLIVMFLVIRILGFSAHVILLGSESFGCVE